MDKISFAPKVSIIVPVYNGYDYISDCIDSIIKQSFDEVEIIIIDDGSTDRSIEILRYYEKLDSRIRLYSRENRGLSFTLRELVDKSQTDFIARVDIDDVCHPRRIEKQYEEFRSNKKLVLHFSNVRYIDCYGKVLGYSSGVLSNYAIKEALSKGNCIFHPSVMFRKDLYYKSGGYDCVIDKYFEDYLLWLSMKKFGDFKCSHLNLVDYRILESSVSRARSEEVVKVYNKIVANGGSYEGIYDDYLYAVNAESSKLDKKKINYNIGSSNYISKYFLIFVKELLFGIRRLFVNFS